MQIVILNYNGADHLRTYLPSVMAYSEGAEVVVADNGSTDHSHGVVLRHGARWLALDRNYGFAEGYNRALAQLRAEVFVLLNSDVRVTPGWLSSPLARLRDDARAAAVQPKVLADARPEYFEYAGASGGMLDALGYPYCRGRIFETVERDEGQYDTPLRCDWATGACLFVRRAAWAEVGGFDGDFFAHMEEIDLCWRLRNRGYTIWCEPSSTVYHLGGGTLDYSSPRKTYLNFRNALLTLVRNEPAATLPAKALLRLALDGAAGVRFATQGRPDNLLAVLRAHGDFYRRLPGVLRSRIPDGRFANDGRVGPVGSILEQYFLRGKRYYSQL